MPPATIARVAGAVAIDAVLVGACATILWLNGGESVVAGPIGGLGLFEIVAAGSLCARCLVIRSAAPQRRPVDIRAEQWVSALDLLLFACVITAWLVSGLYFLGWVATLAAILLLLGNNFQLMVDVTTGRNWRARAVSHTISAHRFASLELNRVVGGAGGVVGLVLTAPIHEWQSLLLNPLALLVTVAMGASVALGNLARRVRTPRVASAALDR
jgi:hypothetical protein